MSVRLIFIGLMVFLGVSFIGVALWSRWMIERYYKDGMKGAINTQTNTEKMKFKEIALYIIMIVLAVVFVIKLVGRYGSGFSALGGFIIMIPARAFFDARRRTHGNLLFIGIMGLVFIYLFLGYMLIGIPQKSPVITVDDVKITASKTTAADLLNDGFDIYVKKSNEAPDYKDMLSSPAFSKYEKGQNILVEKGYRRNSGYLGYMPYLLVKDGIIIGGIELYAGMNDDMELEKCKVIHFLMDEYCVESAKENSIDIKLNDMNLLETLELENVAKNFGKKLWLTPPENPDITELDYGIAWRTNSDHIFWNEYYCYIMFDESLNMNTFTFSTEVARDKPEK